MSQLGDEVTGVSWGWQAQAAITKHQPRDLKAFISQVLEAKFKIKGPADSVPGESLLPGFQKAILLLCSHMAKKERSKLSGVSS